MSGSAPACRVLLEVARKNDQTNNDHSGTISNYNDRCGIEVNSMNRCSIDASTKMVMQRKSSKFEKCVPSSSCNNTTVDGTSQDGKINFIDVHADNDGGKTALMYGAAACTAVVRLLLEQGAGIYYTLIKGHLEERESTSPICIYIYI